MGCGASKNEIPVTKEQMIELCQLAGKEMLRLSARNALKRTDDITVPAPDCVAKVREHVVTLRTKAAAAKAALSLDGAAEPEVEAAAADAPAAEADAPASGMFGKLAGVAAGAVVAAGGLADQAAAKAGGVAGAAAAKAGDVAGSAIETTLCGLADGLEAAVNEFEKPFTTIGKEIMGAKKDELLKEYEKYIATVALADPTLFVRGKGKEMAKGPSPLWGPEEYDAVSPLGLSEHFNAISKEALEKQLLPVVEEEVGKHTITKSSQKLVDTFNAVASNAILAQVGLSFEKIEVGIGPHIVKHTILKLGAFIAENEAEYRKESADKSDKIPLTFAKVYSRQPLSLVDYENREK